ncbi:MAG: hypothetical protein AB7E80_13665 [Hyphomicrobiaceae bacterium]
MTATKLIYLIGTLMPCGIVLIAALALYKAMQHRKQRSSAASV